jgi:hypothetical protein
MKRRSTAAGGKGAKARSSKASRLKRNIVPTAVAHRDAAAEQIAEWLETLGLGQYAQRFADNGVDLSVLHDLTDQDFEKLGVLLGHRRKMLRAIAELNGTPATVNRRPNLTPDRRPILTPLGAVHGR